MDKSLRRYYPIEELGIDVKAVSTNDLEEIAVRASAHLESRLTKLMGRDADFVAIVNIERNNLINVVIDVELYGDVAAEIEAQVDKYISEVFEVVRNELIKRFSKESSK